MVKTGSKTFQSHRVVFFSFAVPIFLSAFLLFQVQPILGKYLLPLFGGSSAVWNTCLLFFQAVLLVGYFYAHVISRLRLKFQLSVHCLLVVLVLILMLFLKVCWGTAILPKPVVSLSFFNSPLVQILIVLGISVGLPFFLLSSTSILIQSWFSRMNKTKSPYSFYTVSNAASFLALLSYPVFFEPVLSMDQQAVTWFWIYGVFTLSIVCTIFIVQSKNPTHLNTGSLDFIKTKKKPGIKLFFYWISLSATASVLLLSVTSRITLDIAPVPFIWIITLSLYLLSFVISFADIRLNSQKLWLVSLIAALFAAWFSLKFAGRFDVISNIIIHSFILFACCVFCHSKLFYLKPDARYLTSFYLSLAAGGVLGGLIVNIFAPVFFKGFWEYHSALIVCSSAGIFSLFGKKIIQQYYIRFTAVLFLLFFSFLISMDLVSKIKASQGSFRNFYGFIQLEHFMVNNIPLTKLYHNSILHGIQAAAGPLKYKPTSYYTKNSGVGAAFLFHPNRKAKKNINAGVIGLGIGTLAAYGRSGDSIRFYEIDHDIIRLACHSRWFSYVKNSRAKIDIIPGDARLSLKNDISSKGTHLFDILAIDAFSGDSIPVHLLTKEAFELYFDHMKKDGILAIHISNRYIDFEPVVSAAAMHFKIGAIMVETKNNPHNSKWILLTKNDLFLKNPEIKSLSRAVKNPQGTGVWTDNHNSLMSILKK